MRSDVTIADYGHFFGNATIDNEGLIVAEIELEHEKQLFDRPHWLGEEITADDRYYNASLAVRAFNLWDRTSGPSAPGA
jgi:adenylate cyclase